MLSTCSEYMSMKEEYIDMLWSCIDGVDMSREETTNFVNIRKRTEEARFNATIRANLKDIGYGG